MLRVETTVGSSDDGSVGSGSDGVRTAMLDSHMSISINTAAMVEMASSHDL